MKNNSPFNIQQFSNMFCNLTFLKASQPPRFVSFCAEFFNFLTNWCNELIDSPMTSIASENKINRINNKYLHHQYYYELACRQCGQHEWQRAVYIITM